MIWSKKYNVSAYREAPKKPGVYILGIPNGYYRNPGEKEDEFLGKNFPEDFEPMYVGISKRSIRGRLYSHYKGSGNENVRDYIINNGSHTVSFVFYETPETEIEHVFLIGLVNGFQWNKKRTELGNLLKYISQF